MVIITRPNFPAWLNEEYGYWLHVLVNISYPFISDLHLGMINDSGHNTNLAMY
jgi:hypothetical protein